MKQITNPVEIRKRHVLVDGKEKRLFSGEVEYFRLDPQDWKIILQRLKDTGMSWVSTYIPWQRHAITPDDIDFDGKRDPRLNVRAYLDLCAKMDLSVYFRPGPLIVSEMTYGGLAPWVAEDPEISVWDYKNIPQAGYKGGFTPSYLHPKYLDEIKKWLEAVNKMARPYFGDKGGPIRIYQLDNEVSRVTREALLQSDYNPVMVGKDGLWYSWLKNKYGDIKKLPYTEKYSVFENILPPRKFISDLSELPYYFDWIEFKEWVLAEYLRRLRKMHEEDGVKGVIFSTNYNPHRPVTICHNWKLFEKAVGGITGYDFYCRPFMTYRKYAWISRVVKMMDALLTLPWSAEYQCGNWSEDVTNDWGTNNPENHEFMALVGLGHGLRAISWYMFHDREHYGFCPVSNLGHVRYTHNAIKKIMKFANGVKDIANLEAIREVGVMFYRPYAWLSHMGDLTPCHEDGNIYIGDPVVDGLKSGMIYKEFEGLLCLLSQGGFNPGIIDPWFKPEQFSRYRVIFVPCRTFMDKDTQKLLWTYVKHGGILIIGPWLPVKDLVGTSTQIFSLLGDVQKISEIKEFTCKTKENKMFKGYKISTGISGGDILATISGIPVVAQKKVGKGKLVFIGSLIGQPYPSEEPEENITFLQDLLKNFKIFPIVSTNDRMVEAIIRRNKEEIYLFVYNIGTRAKRIRLKFHNLRIKSLMDFLTGDVQIVENGRVELSLDCKMAYVYRVNLNL